MDATIAKVRVSRGGGKGSEASPRQALALIADKWAVMVITTLAEGAMRYNALRRTLDGVSQKMLTQTLRDLQCNGLVDRTVYPDTPPRVTYSLTPLGLTLVEALTVLRDWAEDHYHEVEAARAQYCESEVESRELEGAGVSAGTSQEPIAASR
jgi:DNA-binding HxlR family transcriptional regulator